MWARWLLGLMMVAGFAAGESVVAQAPAIPDFPKFVFPTKPEIVIKRSKPSDARPVRGKLISLTSVEVVVDTGTLSRRDMERGELGHRISVEDIESLRSVDGRFHYQPKEDTDFKAVSHRIVAAYASVMIESEGGATVTVPGGAHRATMPGSMPGSPTKPAAPATAHHAKPKPHPPKPAPGSINGGFGGVKALPKQKKPGQSPTDPAHAADASPAHAADLPLTESTDTSYCSNCSKEIPAGSTICPHCKIALSNVASGAHSAGNNPFGKTGAHQATSGANPGTANPFAAKGGTPEAGPAAPVAATANSTGTVVVPGGGFSFDSVPNWAKGGLFVLFVLVGYHLLFNR